MNRDDVIRMAQECQLIGMRLHLDGIYQESLERFAALVAAHVRETEFKPDWNNYQQGLKDGAAEEREACAKVLDEMAAQDKLTNYYGVAANAIRARGQV